jgi:hypothetical protein
MSAGGPGASDNAAWHMLPEEAQNAWRQYARKVGNVNRTSDAFAAGAWWAIQHYIRQAAAVIENAKKEQNT